jgi:phosphonate transport system substrate-binding protein
MRPLIAVLALAALSLSACDKGGETQSNAARGEIHFSILSPGSARGRDQDWRPILADMERQTGLAVKPDFAGKDALLIQAMRSKSTDVGWFSNRSGLDAVRRSGGQVFARTFDPSGADGYKSVLIVSARSKLTLDRILGCDKTLTLGMGDAVSTSGARAPMTYLFAPRNIKPEACFRKLRIGASHQANLYAVAAGQLDVATNTSTSLALDRQQGRHEADEVRVIWESPTLPEDPIIWRRDLDPALKEKLRQFFLTYGQGDTQQAARERANMARINIGGFRPADDSHLLPVREMEATEVWLAARRGGDPAKASAARKALDDITAQRVALEARTRAPAAAQ